MQAHGEQTAVKPEHDGHKSEPAIKKIMGPRHKLCDAAMRPEDGGDQAAGDAQGASVRFGDQFWAEDVEKFACTNKYYIMEWPNRRGDRKARAEAGITIT